MRSPFPPRSAAAPAAHPVFRILDTTLAEALPVVDYLGLFESEIIAQLAGQGAALQGTMPTHPGGPPLHYLRALVPFTAEGLVVAEEPHGSNRANAYLGPRALEDLERGLAAFDCRYAGNLASQPAPPCRVQEPFEFRGRRLAYPHVTRDP